MGANQQTFTDWGGQYDPQAGSTFAPQLGPSPSFRDEKDRRLQAWGQTPEAQYPDGYLGHLTDRRGDKLGSTRSNTRSYAKGVHKGERVNAGDYFWPDEFNPMTALEYEAKGKKWAVSGATPVWLTNDGKAGPRGVPRNVDRAQVELIDQQRRSMLKTLVPNWR